MEQLGLTFAAPSPTPPVKVRARRTDPDTSREAAEALDAQKPKLQRSVETVIQILREHGPLDDFGIAEKWGAYWKAPFSESLPRKARLWAGKRVKHDGYTEHHGRRVRRWTLA